MYPPLALLLALLLAQLSLPSLATEALLRLESRPNVKVPVFHMRTDGAIASVVLLPGGAGGFGKMVDGKPSGENFLVRSRDHFAAARLDVAVMGRASDMKELGFADRISPEHMKDVRAVVDYLRKDTGLPVWLVGTSRGTVSATGAAISLGRDFLAGVVLTSSVTSPGRIGAVPKQALDRIDIPVLVLHHENDGCGICAPHEVPGILEGLRNAPVKKLVFVRGGTDPAGDPCGALHFHGFIGMEKSVVETIAAWILAPSP